MTDGIPSNPPPQSHGQTPENQEVLVKSTNTPGEYKVLGMDSDSAEVSKFMNNLVNGLVSLMKQQAKDHKNAMKKMDKSSEV